MDPISTGIFASIGSAFKFADVALRIAEVGSENSIFVRTIYVVRSDLEEVERLLSVDSVQRRLSATPGKLPWIKTAVYNTRRALNEIGKWVERARVEQESTGSIKFDTRVRWVFSDHEKLLTRKIELSACHQQLSNTLGYLIGLEVAPNHPALQDYEDTTYYDAVLARHRRTGRSKAQELHPAQKLHAQERAERDPAAARPSSRTNFLSLKPGHQNSPKLSAIDELEHGGHLCSSSIAPDALLPGSPPPTYATAVSVDPFSCSIRPPLSNHSNPPPVDNSVIASPDNDCINASSNLKKEKFAHRSLSDDIITPAVAGDSDIVVFSATNSAGPVNPYDFGLNPTEMKSEDKSPRRPSNDRFEMLGDIYHPAEISSGDPGSRPRTISPQVGLSLAGHVQFHKGTVPEVLTGVHRRVLPPLAVSDSLPTVVTLSPSCMAHERSLPELNAVKSRYSATDSSSDGHFDLGDNQPPVSLPVQQAQWSAQSMKPTTNRHYSGPLPAPVLHSDHAPALTANLTSNRGLSAQLQAPLRPQVQDRVVTKRMQNQKRMMDLLGSIGT